MVATIRIFVSCLCLAVFCSETIPSVACNFWSSLFARKRANAFKKLNDYLVDHTKLDNFQANVRSARYLVNYDKFNSILRKHPGEILSDEFKELADSLARLSDGRRNPMGHNFQLCPARNLDRLRNMTEAMNRNIETTGESTGRLRLANLIKQVARAAGRVCFARLERKWFVLKQRNSSHAVQLEQSNYYKIQTGFLIFGNLCQKHQNKMNLEEDDAFLRGAEYSLKRTAKLRPDVVEGALVYKSAGKRPSGETIARLMQKVLLEPCREMYAVRELADTIKPIVDLLVSLVIVNPEDYFYNYIDPLSGEIKEWTRRFVMCEWLLAADLANLSSALSRKGLWK